MTVSEWFRAPYRLWLCGSLLASALFALGLYSAGLAGWQTAAWARAGSGVGPLLAGAAVALPALGGARSTGGRVARAFLLAAVLLAGAGRVLDGGYQLGAVSLGSQPTAWSGKAADSLLSPAILTPLLAHLLLAIGVLALLGSRLRRVSPPRLVLDSILLAATGAMILWYFGAGPALMHPAFDLPRIAVATSSPLVDLLLVFFLLAAGRTGGPAVPFTGQGVARRRPLLILLLAVIILFAADAVFAAQTLRGIVLSPAVLAPLTSAAWMLVAIAVLAGAHRPYRAGSAPSPLEEESPTGRAWQVWVAAFPYVLVPAVAVLVALAWREGGRGPAVNGLYLGAVALLPLILAHHLAVIWENADSNHKLDQARQQRAARTSEKRFRHLVADMPVGVLLVDVHGRVTVANAAALAMLGTHWDDITARPFVEVDRGRKDRGAYAGPEHRAVSQALETGQPVRNVLIQIRRADGPACLLLDAIPMLRDDRHIEQVLCTLADVSERWAAEEALRLSEARLRAIFEHAPIGFEVCDAGGNIVQSNRALQEMVGYEAAELHGRHWKELTHPEDIAAEEEMDQRFERGAIDRYQLEIRHIRKDGEIIWTRQTVSGIHDERGQLSLAIAMVEDISDRKRAQEALTHQALHDALTDLPNRTLLQDRIERAVHSGTRNGVPFALLVMDLDRFKELNDTFGHLYGDLLLQQLSVRLVGALREADTVARLGGDEFAVLLAGADEAGSRHTAAKILAVLREPFLLDGTRFDLDASIGIALFPAHGRDAHDLLRQADVAMYLAKQARTGYRVYSAEHDTNTPARLRLLGQLAEAIEQGGLVLHYQPKLDLHTGLVDSVEALVRWHHPERGLLVPGDFVPLAEHTGLIRALDLAVLGLALKQARIWLDAGHPRRIAINLSTRHLQDTGLVATVSGLLAEHGVPAAVLEVEITESVVMSDPLSALTLLSELRHMGVGVSIDDFGTGYSSLAYLQRLPADEIKIDKSFVLGMTPDHDNAIIARAVIDLGHNLNMRVVAEGVESQPVLDLLCDMGCDVAQGYFVAPPLDVRALEIRLGQLARGARRLEPRLA